MHFAGILSASTLRPLLRRSERLEGRSRSNHRILETGEDPYFQVGGAKLCNGGFGAKPQWCPGEKPLVKGTSSPEADDIFLFQRLIS